MKKFIEHYGKTVEEAIRKGLEELKVSRDDVQIEIIDEPTKGILGVLSNKMAKIRMTIAKKMDTDSLESTKIRVTEIIDDIFKIVGETATYTLNSKEDRIEIQIDSPDSAHLIGYKGKTIDAIQSTINSILQKNEETYAKVFVEVNGYKKQKEEKLKFLARKMEKNAVKFGKNIRLEPMSAYERMIIHTELASSKEVITESIGEEPRRSVIIKVKR